MLVGLQLSALGLYLPPVLSPPPKRSFQYRSKLPCDRLGAEGALVMLVGLQLSALGLYLPPVLSLVPPQTIISVPVQTAV